MHDFLVVQEMEAAGDVQRDAAGHARIRHRLAVGHLHAVPVVARPLLRVDRIVKVAVLQVLRHQDRLPLLHQAISFSASKPLRFETLKQPSQNRE